MGIGVFILVFDVANRQQYRSRRARISKRSLCPLNSVTYMYDTHQPRKSNNERMMNFPIQDIGANDISSKMYIYFSRIY